MAEPIAPRPSIAHPNVALPVLQGAAPMSSEDYLHELRVRIPVDLHRQLLSLKVLRGKSLAETVSVALDIYFAEHAKRQAEVVDEQAADETA